MIFGILDTTFDDCMLRLIKIKAVVDLDDLHDAAEGEGEGDEDEQQGDEGQQVGADAGPLLAHCNSTVQSVVQ